jgi:hypothetical protein
VASFVYHSAKENLVKKNLDLWSGTVKVMLVNSSYTPSVDHDDFSEVSAYEVEDDGVNGYTRKTLTYVSANGTGARFLRGSDYVRFDADNTVWSGITISNCIGAVLYEDQSGLGVTESNWPLVAYFDFDGAKSVTSGTLTISWSDDYGLLFMQNA